MHTILHPKGRDYFFAFVLMLIAVLTQYLVITVGNTPVPGILYPMAFLGAWYYGFGPALMAVICSLFASNLLFYEPILTFKVLTRPDYVRLGIFAATSIVAAWIVARGKKAHIGELKAKSELRESLKILETINSVGKSMSAELDHKKLVQQLTDAGTQLTRAEFGAFFYNVVNENGNALTLYAVSGVPIEEFSKFPMPGNTAILAYTFSGKGIIRSNDITLDPRYGKNPPHNGMPSGHLPVKSYLAIPVISRTGEVIGGLFFGHKKPRVFTESDEKIISGLASQSAIALDNARLFDKATQAIKIRDEFLSISSHELKTPLTPLKIQLQNIIKQIDKGLMVEENLDVFKKNLLVAEKQVNRLTVLVDDLLDVTRITSGKLTLNVEDVDMVEAIKDVSERYRPQLEKAHSPLILDLAPSFLAKIDRIRFEQVLTNLLTNSIKYAPGKPITISLRTNNDKIFLRFSDEGAGIAPEDQKKVFERFERANSHAAQGGLGLGLYIVKQIITAHHGVIEVESGEGKGAAFVIELPR